MTAEEPPEKVRKVEKPSDIKVLPILDPKITCETVPSTSFQALRLPNKKIIGQIIGRLKELPEELKHLKRVGKDGSVLISKNRDVAEQIVQDLKHEDVQKDSLVTVQVPSEKPASRAQFENAKQLWPTGFHPDHELEHLLTGSFLTDTFKLYIDRWTQEAVATGAIAVLNDKKLSSGHCSAHPLGHPVMEMVGSLPSESESEYLGTGCDVFLLDEPCAMCAMALVHFRVKRVFFARRSSNGVFGEDGWQLHLEPSINHHYDVFRVEIAGFSEGDRGVCSNLK